MMTMNEQAFLDYLGISLSITSDQLPSDKITQVVGIKPTYTRERGALTRNGLMRRPEFDLYEWQFREQLNVKPGDHMGDHSEGFITEFLDKIKDAAPQIKALSEDHSVVLSLVYHVRDIPYIGLTRQHVQAIAALGARLDYDIMVESNNSAETEEHVSPVEAE